MDPLEDMADDELRAAFAAIEDEFAEQEEDTTVVHLMLTEALATKIVEAWIVYDDGEEGEPFDVASAFLDKFLDDLVMLIIQAMTL